MFMLIKKKDGIVEVLGELFLDGGDFSLASNKGACDNMEITLCVSLLLGNNRGRDVLGIDVPDVVVGLGEKSLMYFFLKTTVVLKGKSCRLHVSPDKLRVSSTLAKLGGTFTRLSSL